MAKLNPALTVLVISTLLLTVGAVYVYCNQNGSYSGDANINADGTITYTISGPSSNYGYSVFSDTDVAEKIVLYYDVNYRSNFNNRYTQNEYFGVLKQMLERRGASVMYADANELADVMLHPEYAAVFVSGALPDTVYNGTLDCRFVEWMNSGGHAYWSGPEIGRYVASESAVTDLGTGFFSGLVNGTDKDRMYAYNESDMFGYTQMRYDNCSYGLVAGLENTKELAYVSEDGYSSVSVAKLFNGNVTVFGGNMATTDNVSRVLSNRTCCADLIVCGLTYKSNGLEHGTGSFNKNVTSTTNNDVSTYSDVSIWMYTGLPASDWGICKTV